MDDFLKIDIRKCYYRYVTNYYKYKERDFVVTFKYLGDSDMQVNISCYERVVNLDDYEEYNGDELYDHIAYDFIKLIVGELDEIL